MGMKKPAAASGRLSSLDADLPLTSRGRRIAAGITRPVGLRGPGRPRRIGIGVAAELLLAGDATVRFAVTTLRGIGELHRSRNDQGRAEEGEDCLSHNSSPFGAFRFRGNAPRVSALTRR